MGSLTLYLGEATSRLDTSSALDLLEMVKWKFRGVRWCIHAIGAVFGVDDQLLNYIP